MGGSTLLLLLRAPGVPVIPPTPGPTTFRLFPRPGTLATALGRRAVLCPPFGGVAVVSPYDPLIPIEVALVEILSADPTVTALVGGRIYPHEIPQGQPGDVNLPAVVYTVIEDDSDHSLSGAAGISRARIRLEGRSFVYSDAIRIAEAARLALQGYTGLVEGLRIWFVRQDGRASGYDQPINASDDGTHWKSFTLKLTYQESIPR